MNAKKAKQIRRVAREQKATLVNKFTGYAEQVPFRLRYRALKRTPGDPAIVQADIKERAHVEK